MRQLSLGERMRCEVVASLLHAPEILFLDEPTIGLDVTAKAVIRDLVREQSVEDGRTLLLTSHDTGDMERVCDRVIVIHHGRLLLDQSTAKLRAQLHRPQADHRAQRGGARWSSSSRASWWSDAPRTAPSSTSTSGARPIEQVVQALLARTALEDLSIEDPPMEEIVQAIYARAGPAPGRRTGAEEALSWTP